MSKPPDAKFLGFLDKNASDEELFAWLQQAIAEAEKAAGDSEELAPPSTGPAADEAPKDEPDPAADRESPPREDASPS